MLGKDLHCVLKRQLERLFFEARRVGPEELELYRVAKRGLWDGAKTFVSWRVLDVGVNQKEELLGGRSRAGQVLSL